MSDGDLERSSIATLAHKRANEPPFTERVRTIHDAWRDNRVIADLMRHHDRESQYRAATMLYRWMSEVVDDVRSVYGDELELTLTPMPPPDDQQVRVTLSIGSGYELVMSVNARSGGQGRVWHIGVGTRSGLQSPERSAGPDRAHASWTRPRIEELVLTLLAAYERARWGTRISA